VAGAEKAAPAGRPGLSSRVMLRAMLESALYEL
jgi:hypothetical protein